MYGSRVNSRELSRGQRAAPQERRYRLPAGMGGERRSSPRRSLAGGQAVLRRPTQTAAFEAVLGQTDGVAAGFAPVSLARKPAEVAAVMDDVEVGPAVRGRNQFDPTRLRLAWRV